MSEFLYTARQSKQIDQYAITKHDIPGALLMQRAGYELFKQLPEDCHHLLVLIGPGNNGGDGIVTAFFAHQAGKQVKVLYLTALEQIKGDAKIMLEHAKRLGVQFEPYDPFAEWVNEHCVIVDAMLGTGISKNVEGVFAQAIHQINDSDHYVLSADIPSGISADTGKVYGVAVKADKTCTFVCKKQGLFASDAVDYVGELIFNDLGIPDRVYDQFKPSGKLLNIRSAKNALAGRNQNSHKGSYGSLVVIAGDQGMAGAALMNSLAALRMGAGKVHLITHPDHSAMLYSGAPEVMIRGLTNTDAILSLCDSASAVLIGSGTDMHQSWSQTVYNVVKKLDKPIVADAGMLDFITASQAQWQDLIITPHPGEAARMLGVTTRDISVDRFESAKALAETFQAVAVLKGKGTIIAAYNKHLLSLCPYGNPAMATAGMGDVLAGLIAGLRAQGYPSIDACRIAVTLHAHTGDELVYRQGKQFLIASDIYQNLS